MTKLSSHTGCTHCRRLPGGHWPPRMSHGNSILLKYWRNAQASYRTLSPFASIVCSLSPGHFVFSCFIGIFFRKRGNIRLSCSFLVLTADISPVSDRYNPSGPIVNLGLDSEIEDDTFSDFASPKSPSISGADQASTSYPLSIGTSPSLTTSIL